ncbi:hypothetical protein H0H81_010107 [Sphagnurus paluster]|uniref:Uncharacterized protein n=1 Tax=Sphagnurus paluster TaxID=117069 RepID=A0A9P7KL50_9AGAR|nr:hypothetical protein H0H81_010107 [Sphagnurus paluster]
MSRSHDSDPRALRHIKPHLYYRGEHYRHSQNLRGSRTHVAATFSRNTPTLPVDLTGTEYPSAHPPALTLPYTSAYKNCPGPVPPRSWTLTSKQAVEDTLAWRKQALSLLLPAPSPIPSLSSLCTHILATLPTEEFTEIVEYLPQHLRRDLVRHTAVYSPLSGAKLFALCDATGHTDTELLVVGPHAVLRDDHFFRATSTTNTCNGSEDQDEADDSWDCDQESDVEPLNTLILISSRLATSVLFSLPASITRLGLINLPEPFSLHRLPGKCPLLVVLDLSYNTWLGPGAETILERVPWSRWNHLHILGMRECHVSSRMLGELNKGRWDDVEVVQ